MEKTKNSVVIYQAKNGAIELRGDLKKETIWATQAQIASAFSVDVRTVNEHIQNIYSTKELSQSATIRNFRIVQNEGKRSVTRDTLHYNLDLIISVGYRVNSKTATKFRQWATKTLKQHITQGFTINSTMIASNYDKFQKAVLDVQKLLPKHSSIDSGDILELVKSFAGTWFSLDSYDKASLPTKGSTKKTVKVQSNELYGAVNVFKIELTKKKEASELFAQERSKGNLEGILGNVMQSMFGAETYKTVEEKAAHLLYFIVKNHPFNDGNKRTGAFAFIWFLRKTGVAFRHRITPEALTVITLLIAESKPTEKDRMIGLVLLMLN